MDCSYYVHPNAVVETEIVGEGTRIWGWTHVQRGASIGCGCNLGEHCFIEDGVSIGDRVVVKNGVSLWTGVEVGDGVFIGPHAVFTNERFPRRGHRKDWETIRLGEGASIGAGAVICPGVTIGRYATVGAGAVVTKDVPDYALVFGNPASFKGWVCECGLRLSLSHDRTTCSCGLSYILREGQLFPNV